MVDWFWSFCPGHSELHPKAKRRSNGALSIRSQLRKHHNAGHISELNFIVVYFRKKFHITMLVTFQDIILLLDFYTWAIFSGGRVHSDNFHRAKWTNSDADSREVSNGTTTKSNVISFNSISYFGHFLFRTVTETVEKFAMGKQPNPTWFPWNAVSYLILPSNLKSCFALEVTDILLLEVFPWLFRINPYYRQRS